MITKSDPATQSRPWQRALARAVTDPRELLRRLALDPAAFDLSTADAGFPLRVPEGYLRRMRPGDPGDPLLRQVLPLAAEQRDTAGYSTDPVGDLASAARPGLLHKYAGRVLLVTTGACAVHCRYCFRRHFPYPGETARGNRMQAALDYIRADPSIREVILSGGDPLSLSDERLAALTGVLADIPHVETLRLHTRTPVVLPERVDGDLLAWLSGWPRASVVVLHANHAREIDTQVADAVRALAGTGAQLLNQAVLLRGVNDTVEALEALSRRLLAAGVLPYYLHLLDPVAGAAHFNVPEWTARELLATLAARLPGYLVPRLAQEVPGAASKRWPGAVENLP
ncbi:MAG TPA: EF-P beta-lysylation protein EpmB [Gammaproteobacteria bacterium]|nr:EF-P beta-lysylation protein EpmB [Gammaproteobacteria bacterium]